MVALKRAWNNRARPNSFKRWFAWSFPTWFYVLLDSDAGPTMSCNVQFHSTRSWPFLLHPITGDGIWCLQCHCSDFSWHLQLSCCRLARVGSSWRCHLGMGTYALYWLASHFPSTFKCEIAFARSPNGNFWPRGRTSLPPKCMITWVGFKLAISWWCLLTKSNPSAAVSPFFATKWKLVPVAASGFCCR